MINLNDDTNFMLKLCLHSTLPQTRWNLLKQNIDFLNRVKFDSLMALNRQKREHHVELMKLINGGFTSQLVKEVKDFELIAALFLLAGFILSYDFNKEYQRKAEVFWASLDTSQKNEV